MLDTTAKKARRILETEETVTASRLADRLRCSKRHVRRLVETLRDHGVPVEKGRQKRERTYSLPPAHRRTRTAVRLSKAAMRRLYELAREDDPADPESAMASREAESALKAALRAEP